ncbi:MAG: hypothetical protein WD688_13855 [Candidatus Binatia bacterium]
MIVEEFLLLALALIYVAISFGHSPGENSADRQRDIDQEKSQRR